MSNTNADQSVTLHAMTECPVVNVGEAERRLSLISGGALSFLGLLRGRWDGLLMMGFGAGLIYRGLTGHCQLYQALGVETVEGVRRLETDDTSQPDKVEVKTEQGS